MRSTGGRTGSSSAIGASDDNDTTSELFRELEVAIRPLRAKLPLRTCSLAEGPVQQLRPASVRGGGLRLRLILQPHQKLTVEIGPGARQSELQDGEELNETILWLDASDEYQFN